jgi:hypothetical protein
MVPSRSGQSQRAAGRWYLTRAAKRPRFPLAGLSASGMNTTSVHTPSHVPSTAGPSRQSLEKKLGRTTAPPRLFQCGSGLLRWAYVIHPTVQKKARLLSNRQATRTSLEPPLAHRLLASLQPAHGFLLRSAAVVAVILVRLASQKQLVR